MGYDIWGGGENLSDMEISNNGNNPKREGGEDTRQL